MITKTTAPLGIVQAQLDAYNSKKIDDLLTCYDKDAELYALHGALLATGHAEIRQRFEARFLEPDLHARLIHRSVVGNVVIDHEMVTRNFPQGKSEVEMLCIYEINDGRICKATFFTKN